MATLPLGNAAEYVNACCWYDKHSRGRQRRCRHRAGALHKRHSVSGEALPLITQMSHGLPAKNTSQTQFVL
eukprot:5012124-Pyramimonas_sp.AAC.1